MSDKEKTISSLRGKGLLDEPSILRLRANLKRKLKTEAEEQEKVMSFLKVELSQLQNHFTN